MPRIGWRRSLCVLFALTAAAVCGCFAVRVVSETPEGGVVVMPNNSDQWPTYYRNRAEYLMKQRCPQGYVIVSEEQFVDNPAARDGRKPHEHFEYDGGYERISKYEQKSYRIVFRRAEAKGGPAAPARRQDDLLPPKELPPVEEAPPPRRLPLEPKQNE
jgi:hypothetical protein